VLDHSWGFDRFADAIRDLPVQIDRATLLSESFRLYSDRQLSIYYAPFDHVNTRARLAVVGITPGWTQMEVAYRTARQGLLEARAREAILVSVKRTASFAGSMRSNLVTMLDALGLPEVLGTTTRSLFDEQRGLLHTTSAIRYPVFTAGKNYTGHHPRPLDTNILMAFVEERLAPERCLDHSVRRHQLPSDQCLFGFPHPSGANAHRARHFSERRDELRRSVREWFASA
jgi:hypothetical protein